jgi:hypothetical protein
MTRKQEIAREIEQLRQELRTREKEKSELWTGSFWWWILFWPVLVYKCVQKSKQGAELDSKIRDLRERIQTLERESWELER